MEESTKPDNGNQQPLENKGYQNDVFLQLQDVISSLEMCVLSWKNPVIERPNDRSESTLCTGPMAPVVMHGPAQKFSGTCPCEDPKVLNSEIRDFQERNAALKVKLRQTNRELKRSRTALKLFTEEKEKLKIKLKQLNGIFQHSEPSPSISPPTSPIPGELYSAMSVSDLSLELPHCKNPVTALQSVNKHAESLSGSQSSLACASDINLSTMESEMKWLKRHLDRIKEVNNELSLTLEDCKTDSEKLSMHLGKLESTCTALRLALQASEKCLKTYSMLLALAEAKGEILLSQVSSRDLSNLGWNMLPKDLEIKTKLFMLEVRKSFRREGLTSEKRSLPDKTIYRPYAPWLNAEDEQMLKDYIQSLKWDLSSITVLEHGHADTSYKKEVAQRADIIKEKVNDAIKLSMETSHCLQEKKPTRAHIVHDLMDTKKGLSELKACLQLLQTEKRALELQCLTQQEEEKAYMLIRDQLQLEQNDWTERDMDCGNIKDDKHTGLKGISLDHSKTFSPSPVMQQLIDSLKQSNEIKEQVKSLTSQLNKLADKVRAQNTQSSQNIQDFFKAHRNLFLTYKNACRKHQEQQHRLETQAALVSQHQHHQVQKLMENIKSLQKKKTERELGETSL